MLGQSKDIVQFLLFSGVALLPFVDEKRLLTSLAKVYPDLTDEESKKNSC